MSKPLTVCPLCEKGQLEERVGKNPVEYNGVARELDLFYSFCLACSSELGDGSQITRNKRLMTAFKKEVDALLTGAEVRKIREALGISQVEATKIFGGGPVAFSKYESDDITQSEGMDKLLRVAHAVPQAYSYLGELAGLGDKRSRVNQVAEPVVEVEATRKKLFGKKKEKRIDAQQG